MHIKKMKLSDLKTAEYNPRVDLKPGMHEYEKLKQSILEFGFVDPPIYNIQTGNLSLQYTCSYIIILVNIIRRDEHVKKYFYWRTN